MKRLAAIGFVAVAGFLTIPLAAQRPTAAPLEIRALSAKPELVSGGDVLVEIAGPANLTAKNVTVRLNGKDVTASFKPAAESKALVGLLTDLQVGSNAVQASMRGSKATAQLTIVNHPISGPVHLQPAPDAVRLRDASARPRRAARCGLLGDHEGRVLLSLHRHSGGRRRSEQSRRPCRSRQRERIRGRRALPTRSSRSIRTRPVPPILR